MRIDFINPEAFEKPVAPAYGKGIAPLNLYPAIASLSKGCCRTGNSLGYRARSRSAFTLVELLVVMAAVFLMIAVLIPVGQSGMLRARSARSLSNLRQIGVAVNRYVTDHKGFFPYLNADHERTQSSFQRIYWPIELENNVLDHPRKHAHDGIKHEIFRDPTVPHRFTSVLSDYGGNPLVFRNPWGPEKTPPLRLFNIRSPERTIMVCTASPPDNKSKGSWWIYYDYPTGGDTISVAAARLSGGQVGAVFVDGHVEMIPGEKLENDLTFRQACFDPFDES